LHQIGFTNTVALSGTALTQQHVNLIKRYADNLMLCLDGDRAGLAASYKSAAIALSSGMRVKAVRLPEGKDPADIASGAGTGAGDSAKVAPAAPGSEGAKDFTKRVADAQSIVEFFLSVLTSSERDSHKLVLAAERTVLPLIAMIPSPMEREHFVGLTSRSLGMPPEAIRAAMQKAANAARSAPGAESNASYGSSTAAGADRTKTGSAPVVSSERPQTSVQQREMMLRALAANYPDTELANKLFSEYARIIGAPVSDEPVPERAIFEAGLAYGEPPTDTQVQELVRMFEHAVLTEKLQEATQELRRAEAAQDAAAISAFATACKDLYAKLSLI
jgi:DNA primase